MFEMFWKISHITWLTGNHITITITYLLALKKNSKFMDKLKYLKPTWWTASMVLLMLWLMTKGAMKHINLDISMVVNKISVQGLAG